MKKQITYLNLYFVFVVCICICICISKSTKFESDENFHLRPMADQIVPRDEETDAMGEQNDACDLLEQDIK